MDYQFCLSNYLFYSFLILFLYRFFYGKLLNLTKAGLHSQQEFNVEIRDYGFKEADQYFDELWESSVKITEEHSRKETILHFLANKTQTAAITPYEAYAYILKFYLDLYESKKITPYLVSVH